MLSEEGGCARLAMGEFCSGYVFTPRPIAVNETVVIRIVENDWDYDGGLAFGLTTCDPSSLCQGHLPDDADNLLDRPVGETRKKTSFIVLLVFKVVPVLFHEPVFSK